MASGFRVLTRERKIADDLVRRFARLPVANVSDSMSRLSAGGARLRPMHAGAPLAGPALTVKAPPGDNLMFHKAIAMTQPGDVIVLDAGGDLTNALMGEMMLMQLEKRGVAGVVINGAIRDAGYIRKQDIPVYAAGVTHRGPYKNGPGEINVSVAIDGMVIAPGDLILGDDDGILCVPIDEAETILAAALAKQAAEHAQIANIQAGTHKAGWVDETLRKLGCEGVP